MTKRRIKVRKVARRPRWNGGVAALRRGAVAQVASAATRSPWDIAGRVEAHSGRPLMMDPTEKRRLSCACGGRQRSSSALLIWHGMTF
jgi:hypothetical protein